MKKLLLMIPLVWAMTGGQECATDIPTTISAVAYPPYIIHRNKVISAVSYVESRHNPSAVNHKEDAVGQYQIRPVMLRHINHKYGTTFTLEDRYCPYLSRQMFSLLMDDLNPDYDLVLAGNLWNRGKYATDTTRYVKLIQQAYDNL